MTLMQFGGGPTDEHLQHHIGLAEKVHDDESVEEMPALALCQADKSDDEDSVVTYSEYQEQEPNEMPKIEIVEIKRKYDAPSYASSLDSPGCRGGP